MNECLAVRIERHDDTATLLHGFGVADGAAVLDLFKIGFDLLNAVVGAFAFFGFLFLAVKLPGQSIEFLLKRFALGFEFAGRVSGSPGMRRNLARVL